MVAVDAILRVGKLEREHEGHEATRRKIIDATGSEVALDRKTSSYTWQPSGAEVLVAFKLTHSPTAGLLDLSVIDPHLDQQNRSWSWKNTDSAV